MYDHENGTTIPTFTARDSFASTVSSLLPRGWKDLARQVSIWLGFVFGYEVVSSFAGHRSTEALANGRRVVAVETAIAHRLVEVSFQHVVESSRAVSDAASWTYWNSEFTVMGLALLWVYLRRNESFTRFRNTILLTDLVGLIVYFAMPTAPPRMFPKLGLVDTVGGLAGINREHGLLSFVANPYAAMPSLHAADALLVGVGLSLLVRRRLLKFAWALWPAWVSFCVIATGNHFLLDVLAGAVIASVCATLVNAPWYRRDLRRLPPPARETRGAPSVPVCLGNQDAVPDSASQSASDYGSPSEAQAQ
jgi:membrane-associated phospholipid phosphatase